MGMNWRLSRARKAVSRNRWQDARTIYQRAWEVLPKCSLESESEQRETVLTGLVLSCHRLKRRSETLRHCRAGRALGMTAAPVFDLPCRYALEERHALGVDAIEDLVTWACRPSAADGSALAREVESRLRAELRPKSRGADSAASSFLRDLDRQPQPESWVPLYRAELARHGEDWRAAGRFLDRSIRLEPDGGRRRRLRWRMVECRLRAGRLKPRRPLEQLAAQAGKPNSADEWWIAVWLDAEISEPRAALARALEGLARHPLDDQLLAAVERFAVEAGDLKAVARVLPRLATVAGEAEQSRKLLPLRCLLASEEAEPLQALACAHDVCRLIQQRKAVPARCRAFAATLLACEGDLSSDRLDLLAAGDNSPELRRIFDVQTLWLSLVQRDWARARKVSRKLAMPGAEDRLAGPWGRLRRELESRWLLEYASHRQRAWTALESGSWAQSLEHGALSLVLSRDSSDSDSLILIAAAIAGLQAVGDPRANLAELPAPAARRLREDGLGARVPWAVASRLGLRQYAAERLRSRLRPSRDGRAALHAFALLHLSLAATEADADAETDALDHLAAALGAAASLTADEDWLEQFAISRYRVYRHGRAVPPPSRIVGAFSRMLGGFLERRGAGLGLDNGQIKLAWDLEQETAKLVAKAGGLDAGAEDGWAAGPFLAICLDFGDGVRRLIDRAKEEVRRKSEQADELELLASLLGLDVGKAAEKDREKTAVELQRSFSPLGPVVILLKRRQFTAADGELDRIEAGKAAAGWPWRLLWEWVDSPDHRRWLRRECREMRLESAIQTSRELASKVPADPKRVVTEWKRALHLGDALDKREEAAACIGEIAVGRAEELWRRRTRQQRRADLVDRRSLKERRDEALRLLTEGWKATAHPSIQGPLAARLNQLGVVEANAGRFGRAGDLLIRAIRVKSNHQVACRNLVNNLLAQLHKGFDRSPEPAGRRIVKRLAQLETLARKAGGREISGAIERLREQAEIPFYNKAGEALQEDDLETAAGMTSWCLRIYPGDPDVVALTHALAGRLTLGAITGDKDCKRRLALLEEHMPEAEEYAELRIGSVLGAGILGGGLPGRVRNSGRAQSASLNRQAVEAAHAERFAEAMGLLEQALELDSGARELRTNARNIGMAWASRAMERGNPTEFIEAMEKTKELGGDE